MYTREVNDIQVREILANHLNKRKLNKISIDNLNVLSVYPFSAVIYLLKTTYVAQNILTKYTYIDNILNTKDYEVKKEKWLLSRESNPLLKIELVIPNSEKIETCFDCNGFKSYKCKTCFGTGHITCSRCYSFFDQDECSVCNNEGFRKCQECKYGHIKCNKCKGTGFIKIYKVLSLQNESIVDDFIKIKNTDIPLRELLMSRGEIIFEENGNKLQPITHFPDYEINDKSKNLLKLHEDKVKQIPLHNREQFQYQQIRIINIYHCKVLNNRKIFEFYIIGKGNRIYMPKNVNLESPCKVL